jgi:phosphomannomutase/phosphoglucomutase
MAGACTHLAHRVLAARGDSVVSLVEAIDLDFDARSPDPAQDANLAALQESVARNRCDLGVALDGDGDRVVFTDERSVVIRPEQIAALLIQECFHRPTVVYDLKCASLVPRAAAAANGLAMMRPSGHGFIKATMIEQQADLGVEVSGHHFFKALGGGDDGLFTALIVSGLVRRSAKTLSQSIARFAWPAITPDLRVPYRGDAAAALESIAASCGGRVSRLDGVRAEYDSGWALARASITEPAITFRFEASDRQEVHAIAARFLAGVPELSPRVVERIED